MSLEAFIEERKKLLKIAEHDRVNFDYDVVITRRCNVKSRTREENEAAALLLINNQIKNLQEYIETPNVFERMRKHG